MVKMRWNRWVAAGTTALLGTLCTPTVARADAVIDWHGISTSMICKASPPLRPGPAPLIDIAIVQAAVYDAVQAIGGKYKPYQVQIPGASGSPEAAAAKAGHDVLANLFPAQAESLGTIYRQYLAKKGLQEDDPGVAVGQKAAAGIIAFRADDGRIPNPMPPPYIGENAVGKWRPTPPATTPMAAPWVSVAKPMGIQSSDQFRSKPFPALSSEQYAKDYNEIKGVGAKTNSTRTPEQTELADFYHSAHLCLTFQSVARDVAMGRTNKDIDGNARLFLLTSFAMADGIISSWNDKIHYNLWRPITAIQEGENDGNPETAGDPTWQPYLDTPPYSDYSSGANAVTAGLTHTLALFCGKDDVTFKVTSESPTAKQKTRTYSSFSAMQSDMVDARIYQGIHFRFADVAGREQGTKVADWIFERVANAK